MQRLYDAKYLYRLMDCLGTMMDYAVYDLQFSSDTFFAAFLSSDLVTKIQRGTTPLAMEITGIDLARQVVLQAHGYAEETPPTFFLDKSPEYWAAWTLTYFQWESALSFGDIMAFISFGEVVDLYPALHETDIQTVGLLLLDRYRYHQRKCSN